MQRLGVQTIDRALGELLRPFGIENIPSDLSVTGIELDSRRIRKGDLFIALAGSTHGPFEYVDVALERGAAAVLVESGCVDESDVKRSSTQVFSVAGLRQIYGQLANEFYGRPSDDIAVIGVTGTNGKTSVSQYAAQLLTLNGIKAGVIGTMGVGFPSEGLEETGYTTPDVVQVHRSLLEFKLSGADAVVMEVSSHGLDQGRVDGVRFVGAVFTNLTRDHLDYHGSMERYGDAKAKLFIGEGLEFAILNGEDKFSLNLSEVLSTDCRQFVFAEPALNHFSRKPELSLRAADFDQGMRIALEAAAMELQFEASLVGRFNVLNAMAAISILMCMGIDLEKINGCEQLSPVPGRMNVFYAQGLPKIVVDYAHTPDALENVLKALKPYCTGELVVLFGCGGDRDSGKRPEMAKVAETFADRIMLTDDNPRSEDPEKIVSDILAGIMNRDKVSIDRDRKNAIKHVIQKANEEDWVLVAGKGHENYQLVGGEKLSYSDLGTIEEIIAQAKSGAFEEVSSDS